ncbi:hypothetical protein ES708_17467 [subsurface metagenome]
MTELTDKEQKWLEIFAKKHEFFKPFLEQYKIEAHLSKTQYYWLNLFVKLSEADNSKTRKKYFKQSIIRIPCPHCTFLCAPQIKYCPKCGDPLPIIEVLFKMIGDSEISSIDYVEKNIIHSLEKQTNKPIPLKEKFDINSTCYVKEDEEITGLSLYKCELNYFPSEILRFKSLKHLALRRNNITTLMKEIGLLSNLEYLNLRINKLKQLPASIGLLSNLQYLNLSSNALMELPKSIGKLIMLKELNLSNNKLTKIPESIGDLNSLEILNLKANYWMKLPESIIKLKEQGLQVYK